MKIQHKTFTLDKIEVKDDAARTVEGWASTFGNKDSYDDIVLPGAFADSLKVRTPKMLWQHNTAQVIGVWDTAQETDKGLYVKGRILNTTLGNDAYELLKAGAVDTMSIGYSTVDATVDYESGVRQLKKLDLWEVSLVTFPANDQAKVTMVKAVLDDVGEAAAYLGQAMSMCDAYISGEMQPTPELLATLRDLLDQAQDILTEEDDGDEKSAVTPRKLERILRDAGLSKREARGFVAQGYPALNRCDADKDKSELINILNQFR